MICGLRDGNRGAWTALYNGYSADVWRHVARLLGRDAAAIADVVQDVFLAAAKSARQFDPERGTLWSWLTGIAQHQIAAHWRQVGKVARLRKLIEDEAIEISHLLDAAKPLDGVTDAVDLADLVRVVLSQLPADYAALLTAKYVDDQSLEELAGQFGGPVSSVEAIKSRLARARREFRTKFEQFEQLDREPSTTTN
ncbi:MAG: rpoE 3 [Planctomycetaceae bacterium]|nr:rpoE 3 [Planctomycetaceae bacterium]